jgi:HNH endonuclease
MDPAVRALVLRRAANRCEYCLLRQDQLPCSAFHIEHIIPRKHGGNDEPTNLALACDRCNSHKGANLTGVDPKTGEISRLFNPRQHSREEQFRLTDIMVVGLTAAGRTIVSVLNMNEERRVRLRAVLKREGSL